MHFLAPLFFYKALAYLPNSIEACDKEHGHTAEQKHPKSDGLPAPGACATSDIFCRSYQGSSDRYL